MTEHNSYTIRRDDWQEVLASIRNIEKSLVRLEERENAWNDRLILSQETANRALALAQQNGSRITLVESQMGQNKKSIDGWQGMAFKIAGQLSVLGIVGAIGFMVGGG